jgi:hypothetical protein
MFRAHVVKPIGRSFFQRTCQGGSASLAEQRPYCVHGIRTHDCGSAGGENAVNHLFPQQSVGLGMPDAAKISQPRANLFLPRTVRGLYSFDRYWFGNSLRHAS